jgi:hypothetical protein
MLESGPRNSIPAFFVPLTLVLDGIVNSEDEKSDSEA